MPTFFLAFVSDGVERVDLAVVFFHLFLDYHFISTLLSDVFSFDASIAREQRSARGGLEGLLADGHYPLPPEGQRQCSQPGRIHATSPLLPERPQRNMSRPTLGRCQSRCQESRMIIIFYQFILIDSIFLFLIKILVRRHAATYKWALRSRGSHAYPRQCPVQRFRAEQGNGQ